MENNDQPNENQNTDQSEGQNDQENQTESATEETTDTQSGDQDQKPIRSRRKKAGPCPDCVKNDVSTGLQDASTLCPTCEGSGSVAVV